MSRKMAWCLRETSCGLRRRTGEGDRIGRGASCARAEPETDFQKRFGSAVLTDEETKRWCRMAEARVSFTGDMPLYRTVPRHNERGDPGAVLATRASSAGARKCDGLDPGDRTQDLAPLAAWVERAAETGWRGCGLSRAHEADLGPATGGRQQCRPLFRFRGAALCSCAVRLLPLSPSRKRGFRFFF